MLIRVRVKPEKREQFLKVIEHDALASEGTEAGCLRFNVMRDTENADVYYFYEVYRDKEAQAAHRATPHFAEWQQCADECLVEPATRTATETVFPADPAYWAKK